MTAEPRRTESLVLDEQQVAALFRLCIRNGLGGCQFEQRKMRWWLPQGLLLELAEGEWLLSMVPTRCAGEEFTDD